MDWGKFLTDNIAVVAGMIGVILGSIVGGGITYYVQHSLLKTQRNWDLDDRRRNRDRELLITIAEKLSELMTAIENPIQLNLQGFDYNSISKILPELGILRSTIQDSELENLFKELGKSLSNFQKLDDGLPYQNEDARLEALNISLQIKHRVQILIDDTYNN